MKKLRLQAAGFSLVEVMVSVVIFSVIILSTTQIFKMVIDSQRNAIATQNVQESLKYFLEVVGKEIRTAKKNEGICPGISDDEIYAVGSNAYGDTLQFKNYDEQCVTYYLGNTGDEQRFLIARDSDYDYISPATIWVDNLDFVMTGGASTTQPAITINLKAHALNQGVSKAELKLQTTLTSRYYK